MRVILMTVSLLGLGLAAKAEDAKAEAGRHFGTWRQVAVVVDGKELPVGPATLLIVTPEGYTVTVNGAPYQKGTTKSDTTMMPVQSDVTIADGPQAGTTLKQISKIEGDVLIACIGKERPTEFTSKPGSGHTLSVWLRVK